MKFIDDFMDKKAQEAVRKENEQIERKARLSELESKNKQKRRVLLHPIKSANERKEIENLKREISVYEEEKENKGSLIVLLGLLIGGLFFLCILLSLHKTTDTNSDSNETIVAETQVDAKEEVEDSAKDSSIAENVAKNDEQSSNTDSTDNLIVVAADASDENSKTVSQESTEPADEQSSASNSVAHGIKYTDFSVIHSSDYAHASADADYIGNDEGITITIKANNGNMEIEDLIFDYDESLLNIDIKEPDYQNGETVISAYVTANSECNTELFITSEYEVEVSDGGLVNGYLIPIRKLDPSEGRVVYITPTGTKYHFDANCAGENAVRTLYHDVSMLEYEPCGTCAN